MPENLSHFVLQSDPMTQVEKAAVRQAIMLGHDDSAVSFSLNDAQHAAPGSLSSLRTACPVGTVEFCRAWMRATGVREPEPTDYPDCLQAALGRVVRRTTFGQAAIGSWVKPQSTKAWDAHVKNSDLEHPAEELVWDSPVIHEQDWLAEWRVYVLAGRIVGVGRYDGNPRDDLAFDVVVVSAWVDTYTLSRTSPLGYALDVALMADGRTILVEVTDGWAVGYYKGSCTPTDYALLLASRWREIVHSSDSTTNTHHAD